MKYQITIFCVIVIQVIQCQISFLDQFVLPFRQFRLGFARSLIKNSQTTSHQRSLVDNHKLQPYITTDFPCDVRNTRSSVPPMSVHQLRPGDIDIIGAIGDSLTAGFGITATNILEVTLEERDKSFSIGGRGTWRQYLTIPNILKEFNPDLFGYSKLPSLSIQRASQFNVAEGGAISVNTPYMAKILVQRITKDKRVDLNNHWKLITYHIGGNDFCSEICYYQNPEVVLEKHRQDLKNVLRILKNNLPRTIVQILVAPDVKPLSVSHKNRPPLCAITLSTECPCMVGVAYQAKQDVYANIIKRWQLIDMEVANDPEFDTDDFTVVASPMYLNTTLPRTNGIVDYGYFSEDCFHFSQKGHALVANGLWNNLLEPIGSKTPSLPDKFFETLKCPDNEHPFIYTRRNSYL